MPGVAEVASIGGFVREYQVQVDPNRLRSFGIPLAEVVAAVRSANQETGGGVIEIAGHEQVIRGRGLIAGPAELEQLPLRASARGAPITLRDVAVVRWAGDAPRPVDPDGEARWWAGSW